MHHRRQRAAACLALGAVLVLAGCGGGDRDAWTDDGWRYDMGNHLHYRPGAFSSEAAVIQARLPTIEATEGVWLEAQRTPPESRVPIPAPDDYFWHAVAVVGPEKAETLLAEHPATAIGGDSVMDDAALHDRLLPPLVEHAGSCPAGWVPVLIGTEATPEYTAEGSDWIDTAVVCPGGDRVVATTFDT